MTEEKFIFVSVISTMTITYLIVNLIWVQEVKSGVILVTTLLKGNGSDTGEDGKPDEGFTEYYDYNDDAENSQCLDHLATENCSAVVSAGRCGDRQDMLAMLCMKSCGYCLTDSEESTSIGRRLFEEYEESSMDEDTEEESSSPYLEYNENEESTMDPDPLYPDYNEDTEDARKNCEDKLPTCSAHYSQEFCCQMKQAMNYSCEKTCKFCSQTPATLVPPGSAPLPPGQIPTATSNQDPCRNNEGQPPSVTVDGPEYPGITTSTTTTTTNNPLASILPSVPAELPGITSTTTTTTTTTKNPLATVVPTPPPKHPITPPPSGR